MHPCPPDGSAFQPHINDNHPPLLGFQITKLLVLVEKNDIQIIHYGYLIKYIYIYFKDNFSTPEGRKTLYSNVALCLHDKTHVITYEHII